MATNPMCDSPNCGLRGRCRRYLERPADVQRYSRNWSGLSATAGGPICPGYVEIDPRRKRDIRTLAEADADNRRIAEAKDVTKELT